jgi:hypothetical protein
MPLSNEDQAEIRGIFQRQVEQGDIPELFEDSRIYRLEATVAYMTELLIRLDSDLKDIIHRIEQLERT